MRYMLLAYTNVDAWNAVDVTSEEFQAMCAFYEQLGQDLTASGELVDTAGLADPAHTTTVARQGGAAVVTDGPFAEAKEALASYAVVDCASHDRATEIAARIVEAVGDTVEVRPMPDQGGGQEM